MPLTKNFAVPTADSTANNTFADVIGSKDDTHDGDSISATVHRLDEHVHESQRTWPDLDNCIPVAGGAGAWELGDFVELVPAGGTGILGDFDIHFVTVEMSAADEYQVNLYAVETFIGSIDVSRPAGFTTVDNAPMQTPIIPAQTQIQAKVASSTGGDTGNLKFEYHVY